MPASALESLVLPARVAGYTPAMLDELTTSGEVQWAGQGTLPGNDGWVALHLSDTAPLLLPEPAEITLTPLHEQVLEVLGDGSALFFRTLSDRVGSLADADLVAAVWDLVWAGYVTNDTLAPLRTVLGAGRGTHRPRARRRRVTMPSRTGPPTVAGRWWLLPERETDPTRRSHALAEALLERHGVLTRGAVAAERTPGGFAAVYPVLRAFEESGRCRRGYFVEGLGAAQFALPGAVDRLRTLRGGPTGSVPAAFPPEWPAGGGTSGDPGDGADDGADRSTHGPAPDLEQGPPDGPSEGDLADGPPAVTDTYPDVAVPRTGDGDAADSDAGTGAARSAPGTDGAGWETAPGTPVWAAGGDIPGADGWATPRTDPAAVGAVILAATDPANPYGAALPWPESAAGHRPGRKAGALVVLVDGHLVLYVERGGRTLLSWSDEPARLRPAVDALALAVREGALGRLTVERADGELINDTPLGAALEAAGFHPTPRGLRLRA